MAVVGRLNQYASMLCQEFDEVTVTTNVNISGVGTYFATEFSENVGITTTLTANVFPPYDPVYDEFGGTLFGAGQGRYMRQNTDQTVIVYNEIDEVTDFYGRGIIVRDGLVFDLDASVSASYPGSGTTWTDLIRNTISTLENGVVFNSGIARGVMSFDGVDDRVTFANTAYSLGSTFSIEVWSYWNSASAPANNPWAGCMYTNSAVSDWNVGTGSNSGLLLGFNSMRYKNISNSEIGATWTNPTTQAWHQFVITMNSGTGYVYVDKSQVYTATDFKTSFSTSGTYGIGVADVFGSIRGTWNGYIPICRVYVGKALTISEITQNFNTLRGRFGI